LTKSQQKKLKKQGGTDLPAVGDDDSVPTKAVEEVVSPVDEETAVERSSAPTTPGKKNKKKKR
jgi:hypothetical protein